MFIEYEAVMTRTEQLAASGVSAADVGQLLDALVTVAEPVQIAFLWRPQLTDPNDEMVLETAVNGHADRLVTFNRRHFAEAGKASASLSLIPVKLLPLWRTDHEKEQFRIEAPAILSG